MSMLTARMDAGDLKATHSPTPERAVPLKAEHKHLSRTHVSCLHCSFGYVLVACKSHEPFSIYTCAAFQGKQNLFFMNSGKLVVALFCQH